ncbi:unnamed protein product [Rotaria socialis]|uniref:Uncharacterized protein n=1 Tax=Rotaria socialis TaxID=392032 RepID=A0A817KS83_9BILA|nr:unnamed protein product [Rotaria socialis]CAF3306916.1 unnamed protein product [Rotaria socialis]CAF4370406.1 unnamed protein product [Rotaria socialis]CAF4403535.1 unnamed protein product [Rotaria socialis]
MERSKLYQLTDEASKKLYEPVNDIESLNQWRKHMVNLIDEISRLKLSPSIDLNETNNNRSLDPTDWLTARHVAHQMLDTSLESIQSIRNRPVWQPIPIEIRASIEQEPLPEHGQTLPNVCQDVLNYVFPYTRGNTHPRFWGWVMGEGTLGGILAEMMMATTNINAGGCTHSAVLIERTVIQWM